MNFIIGYNARRISKTTTGLTYGLLLPGNSYWQMGQIFSDLLISTPQDGHSFIILIFAKKQRFFLSQSR